MDYDGLPPATQPLALLDNRSTKQVIELLHALFRNLELNKVEPWYPLNHPDNQHHAQLLVTLADSIMKLFPRPGTPNWDPEWTQLCALSLDIQGRLLGKVAMLYDEKKTRPPEGAERMEQAWLGMLFSVLGLANAWVLDESIVLDEGERECFTVLGRKCVDVAGGMMRLLGSSLTLGDDPARPAWEVMRPCVDELVRFVSDAIASLCSPAFPLECSLFTVPRIYGPNTVPDPPAIVSFPVTSNQSVLASAIEAVAILVSSLASPLSADVFLKSCRRSVSRAICDLFAQLDIHSEPKILARLLHLTGVWLTERPSDSIGITGHVWRVVARRIQSDSTNDEPAWGLVDEELGKLAGFFKLEVDVACWPDVENALVFCANQGGKNGLRTALCQLLTTQIELVPKEVLQAFQTIPANMDDSPQALVELRRAITTRLQTTETQAGSRKRKREDSSINLMDGQGDVVMGEASQAFSPEIAKKRASYENICANVFGGRQNWLVGGLGPDGEADEVYQGRVMDGLLAELDSLRPPTSDAWSTVPCILSHPLSTDRACPTSQTGTAKTVLTFVDLCTRFNKTRGVPAYNGLALALKHLNPEYGAQAMSTLVVEKVLMLLETGLERPERTVRLAAGRAMTQFVAARQRLQGDEEALTARPLAILTRLVSEGKSSIQETALSALGDIGKIATDFILGRIILAHITLLQRQNLIIKGLAYAQLLELGNSLNKAPFQLLAPYLKDIAPLIVGKLLTSPGVLTDLCQLLTVTPRDFLAFTRAPTLAAAVKSGNRAVIDAVAALVERNPGSMLLEDSFEYLPEILLMEDEAAVRKAMKFLCLDVLNTIIEQRTKKKDQMDEARLLRTCTAPLLAELSMHLASEDQIRCERAAWSLHYVAEQLTLERGERSTPAVNLSSFLMNHMLGVMIHINDALQDGRGKTTMARKNQVLKSLGVLIERVGAPCSFVAPQIMATLQTTLATPGLSEAALATWSSFIRTLTLIDAAPLLSVTTAAISANWATFSPECKECATKILDYLVVENGRDIRQHLDTAVSLSHIPELRGFNRAIKRLRSHSSSSPNDHLEKLLARSSNENMTVAIQSLNELRRYILEARNVVEDYMVGDVFNPLLARTMKVLFSAACREGEGSERLRSIAYECIGLVGALDPDRFDMQPDGQGLMVMANFTEEEETIWFTVSLISDVLVATFRSTTDLKYQRHLGYSIQELVKQCGFTTALLKGTTHSVPSKVRNRWKMLSQDVVETIGPLLEGRFTVKSKPPVTPKFPIYAHSSTHREWVQTWTAHLISCVKNPRASQIFEVFRPPIRNNDVRVAKLILPHLIITISQSDGDIDHILQEIVAVLKDQVDSPDGVSDPRKALSAQTVFDLMDHLSRWIRCKNQQAVRRRAELRKGRGGRDVRGNTDIIGLEMQRAKTESLLSMIDTGLLSDAAFRCRAFARSLMSFEKDIISRRERKTSELELQPFYERLHEIYASLDEPDGMEGASKMVVSPSLEQQIRGHEMIGRWTSAQSCWEIKLQQEPDSLEPHLGLLRCLRNLGHHDTMKTHIHGVLSKHPTWEPHLADFFVEGAWKLGDWDTVERLAANPQRQSPEITLARLLLSARQEDSSGFSAVLRNARDALGRTITSNGPTSYRRSYEAVLHLHLAREIESIHSAAASMDSMLSRGEQDKASIVLNTLTHSLDNRFKSTLPTFRVQEPVLSMRRTAFALFKLSSLKNEIGRTWLTSAKIAIKASHHQTAYSSILQAQQNGMTFAFVQGCKLTKALGEPLRALQELSHSIENVPNMVLDLTDDNTPDADPRSMAKALLLRARWMHEAGRYEDNVVIERFQMAAHSVPDWESPYFRLGQYYDECYKQMDKNTQELRGPPINVFTCRYYVQAMRYGSKYIFQTMPRLLTIWLDMAQKDLLVAFESDRNHMLSPRHEHVIKAYKGIHAVILDAVSQLQAYQWFTALPQLISRITHPNKAAYKQLSRIITKIVLAYPQQALWGVSPLIQSRNHDRVSRGREILDKAQGNDPDVRELVLQSVAMVKELLAMSERETPENESTLAIQRHFPGLARLAPSKLIMPLQEYLTVNLPPSSTVKDTHQPFPSNIPKFNKFNDDVEIMKSLQKPRKISALSEEGLTYIFLCKPKDDLRKDARLMDLNSMINKLLKKNAESRRRQLHIRTYAVVILNEECGFLEWVPNTIGYRNIIVGLYEQRGMPFQAKAVLDWVQSRPRHLSDKEVEEYWKTKLIPSVLINLHEYFVTNFSEPTAWLSSRLAYTRTAAVMSMVGHILGLGDRHGENLLFDTVNGDLVHVDLNCLFERGATFEIPETVPFRLTENMVDGFGVTGVEGAFRTACEVTMQLLRDNYGSLISVLDAFVHDPLVEWEDQRRKNERDARMARQKGARSLDPRGRAGMSASAGPTDIQELARNAMLPIGRKLQGLSREGRVVSVSNQVEALIREATDPVRLARMYVGWMAWI